MTIVKKGGKNPAAVMPMACCANVRLKSTAPEAKTASAKKRTMK